MILLNILLEIVIPSGDRFYQFVWNKYVLVFASTISAKMILPGDMAKFLNLFDFRLPLVFFLNKSWIITQKEVPIQKMRACALQQKKDILKPIPYSPILTINRKPWNFAIYIDWWNREISWYEWLYPLRKIQFSLLKFNLFFNNLTVTWQ